tara:strand:- start:2616 stop:5738 length:3123 start_codon:yes stop_codon:yes gene_type:complete
MSNLTTNLNLTQIAIKRLSGKAMTNSNFTIAQEPIGSTVQTAAGTIFGEAIPPSPDSGSGKLNIIQSSSVSSPGSVQLVMFEINASGTEYQNTVATDAGSVGLSGTGVADEGETTISTFHAYTLRLTGSYEADNATVSSNFNSLTSTPTNLGSFPYEDNAHLSGSIGRLQILPEYVGLKPGTTPNPYTPVLFNQNGTEITPGSDIDWYLDPYSGMLFVQDPVDYETGDANSIPTKLKAFIYTGKYQDQMSYGISDISLHISASEGTAFDLVNTNTASFESGSAGITVTADASKKITIGASTDDVFFNDISASGNLFLNKGVHFGDGNNADYFDSVITASADALTIEDNQSVHVKIDKNGAADGGSFQIQAHNSNDVRFIVSSSGKVGIGTTTPTHQLSVVGDGTISGNLTASNLQILETASITYFETTYQSSSIIFSSGSTKFGDSNDDTHIFTGSVSILYTGSNGAYDAYGIEITGSGLHIEHDLSISASGDISASALYLTNEFTALDGGVTINSNTSPELYVGGNITASGDISASGLLFASASDNNGVLGSIAVAMYDTASGRLYYTGSSALGDTTLLEASASAGIFLSASEGTGFSIGLMQSASFTSGSGGGLTVEAGVGTNNIEFTLVGVLSSSQQIATDISGAIDAATGSVLLEYGLLSGSAQIASDISGSWQGQNFVSASQTFLSTGQRNGDSGITGSLELSGTGHLTASGDISSSGDVIANNVSASGNFVLADNSRLQSVNQDTTYIKLNGDDYWQVYANGLETAKFSNTQVVINETGQSQVDFRVESDNDPHLLFTEASSGKVTMGTSTPSDSLFTVARDITVQTHITASGDISSSGNLSALVADNSSTAFKTVMYDTATGKFFRTGSYGGGIDVIGTTNEVAVTYNGDQVIVGLPDDVIITGDLTVNGTTTTLNTQNLLVEDKYILLASGAAANNVGGGIVIQRGSTTSGTALHWDHAKQVWAVDIDGADASSAGPLTAQAAMVFASHSSGNPTTGPLVGGGSDANYKLGQMYVNTTDTDGDGNTIWIYAT